MIMIHAFVKLFHEGGWIIYPIFLVSVMVWYIGIGKIVRLRRYFKARLRFLSALDENAPKASLAGLPSEFNTLAVKLQSSRKKSIRQRACTEFMSAVIPRVQSGVSTISACVVMAPLLGLLGTISGMNSLFSVIAIFGFGNPTIMSHGIGVALRATLTGLGVAYSADICHRALSRSF